MAEKSEDNQKEDEYMSLTPSMSNKKEKTIEIKIPSQKPTSINISSNNQELPPLKKPILKSKQDEEIQKVLIDNFVNLQKVMTNLAIKFDELSLNINKLLQLFEISAKNFAEKYSEQNLSMQGQNAPADKELIEKLDNLLDQNKIIAKGIMLMEEKLRIKANEDIPQPPQNQNPQLNRQELPPISSPPQTQNTENRFGTMFRSRPLPKF